MVCLVAWRDHAPSPRSNPRAPWAALPGLDGCCCDNVGDTCLPHARYHERGSTLRFPARPFEVLIRTPGTSCSGARRTNRNLERAYDLDVETIDRSEPQLSEIPSYFGDFLEAIRLPPELRTECEDAHKDLRAKLHTDRLLSPIIISTFLQGSYRRHTGVRPLTEGDHVDVDVVVVTNVPIETPPKVVIEQLFRPFLDRHYPKHWEPNDRSIKITPTGGHATIDLVPTSAPSEIEQQIFREADPGFQIEARGDLERQPLVPAEFREAIKKITGNEQWQREPLMIPSRDLERWVPTHPLAQIYWTDEKGGRTNGHYINVVKAGKWWRKRHADGEYPKGYPLEHVMGVNCPDEIESVAEGLTRTLESICNDYRVEAASGQVPYLRDHGVDQNVFHRITPEQFATFWHLVDRAAVQAREALNAQTVAESAGLWRDLLGPEFPEPKEGGFVPPVTPATIRSGGRFG